MFYENNVPEFNVTNFTLPMLVSEAAVEMANCINYGGGNTSSLKYLSALLQDATRGDEPRALRLDNMAVLMAAIPGREHIHPYWDGKYRKDIVSKTHLLAAELAGFERLSRDKQLSLIGFCVRLNEEVAYHQDVFLSVR